MRPREAVHPSVIYFVFSRFTQIAFFRIQILSCSDVSNEVLIRFKSNIKVKFDIDFYGILQFMIFFFFLNTDYSFLFYGLSEFFSSSFGSVLCIFFFFYAVNITDEDHFVRDAKFCICLIKARLAFSRPIYKLTNSFCIIHLSVISHALCKLVVQLSIECYVRSCCKNRR